ncbi:EAL domain-containing protein [Pseudodesulfovibrio sediminis]|uniref:Diguanylate phosphodiesterase n=1 Tax=Pseudodesulfovibrio sediminis TaxID=2810563 RepID=A0ABM7P8N7_9BACT|nr:EAL domain-containing protein [Pseudodesulfovibrio sediminis]BCS89404.1 diguanylate phosphodiesterase [Pseudodesulfovibrio sediminis]
MPKSTPVKVDEQVVRNIISSKDIITFFQPVLSITTKSIVGFEAYSRAGKSACAIEASQLFYGDLSSDLKVDVDRLCREKALEQFKPIHAKHKGMHLFLNINPDMLSHLKTREVVLPAQVEAAGIPPSNIVLEWPFSPKYMEDVADFCELFSGLGFKICLDGCSVDDSFSHVLTKLQPDMVKIDRSFFGEDERKSYSARTLEALRSVAERIGAVVIGQQVESEAESLRLLTAGIHLQQGDYYTKDEHDKTGDPAKMFFKKILDTHEEFKLFKRKLVSRKKERFGTAFRSVTSICSKFANLSEDRFEEGCKTIVKTVGDVISVFVVDEFGVQITSRVHGKSQNAATTADFLLSSGKGADHSVEDYVLYLDMGYEKFVTTPFSSPFTGETACIISKPFFSQDGERYTVCIELPYPG